MLRRISCAVFLLLLFASPAVVVVSGLSMTRCPYDIPTASRLVPQECYANYTAPPPASCCWYVYAAVIYAAALNANHTGTAFLQSDAAASCSTAFVRYLITSGLIRASLLLNGTCDLIGTGEASSSSSLAAGARPCQYFDLFTLLSVAPVTFANATQLCAGSTAGSLYNNHDSCEACKKSVIAATFALINAASAKEVVPCGMAATIGIWSQSSDPSPPKFRSYVLCLLQVLEDINTLGTDFVPSPPPLHGSYPDRSPAAKSESHRSTSDKIAIGSSVAGFSSVLGIAALAATALYYRRRRRFAETEPAPPDSLLLPTEGLYIFTKSELKQATKNYDEKLLLGAGGAGKVYLGTLPSGQQVAIKRIYRDKRLAEFYSEVAVLAQLRHRNLTTLVGYCLPDRSLVYEYMPGGNLSRALYHYDRLLMWRERLRIAVDVAEGLTYLHEFSGGVVVHRDVKPTNVLLTAAGEAKLSDFGVARVVPAGETHVSTEVRGTMGYLDPESFSVGHVSEASDVYSFGVVLLELITGMRAVVPTPSGGAESLVHSARRAVTDDVDDVVDRRLGDGWDRSSMAAAYDLAYRCVRPYKSERPKMAEVLAELQAARAELMAREGDDVLSPP